MKFAVPAVLVLVALVGFAGLSPVPAQPAPKAVQFDYKFLSLTHANVANDEKNLNDLAAEGWEVVTGTTQARVTNASPASDARLVLKRPKR
jgi:hypothetical protein